MASASSPLTLTTDWQTADTKITADTKRAPLVPQRNESESSSSPTPSIELKRSSSSTSTALTLFANPARAKVSRQTKPLQGAEHVAIIFSTGASFAAASGSYEFAKKFLENVIGSSNGVWLWTIAGIAFIPQAILSGCTNLNLTSIFVRTVPTLTRDDVSSNAFPLTAVAFSCAPTFKVAMDLPQLTGALAPITGSFRVGSAFTFNSKFLMDHLLNKRLEAERKDSPIIAALLEAKSKLTSPQMNLGNLAARFQEEGHPNLLKYFNEDTSPENFLLILNILVKLATDENITKPLGKSEPGFFSTLFGILSAAMFWNTAIKVPSLFSLPVSTGIVDFIRNMITPTNLHNLGHKILLGISFGIGGGLIGMPAWILNAIANRAACNRLWNKMCDIASALYKEGPSKYSWDDWLFGVVTLFFSAGLGIVNGGMAYKYPLLDFELARIINAITTGISFMGLGFMSLDGFKTTLTDKYHQQLLLDAFKAKNLTQYIEKLTPDDQVIFYSLLKKYLDTAITSLCSELIKLKSDIREQIIPRELLDCILRSGLIDDIERDYVGIVNDTETRTLPPFEQETKGSRLAEVTDVESAADAKKEYDDKLKLWHKSLEDNYVKVEDKPDQSRPASPVAATISDTDPNQTLVEDDPEEEKDYAEVRAVGQSAALTCTTAASSSIDTHTNQTPLLADQPDEDEYDMVAEPEPAVSRPVPFVASSRNPHRLHSASHTAASSSTTSVSTAAVTAVVKAFY